MPSYESSMRNLAKAKARWRPPRPWRSDQESQMIRRYVIQWLTCRDRSKPSGRAWARGLGISHTWLQKLVRRFQADPSKMLREARRCGDPTFAQLTRASAPTRKASKWMSDRGKARRRSARGATSRRRVTIIFPSGVSSSFLSGAFWFSCCTACDASTVGIAAWWSRRFPGAMGSTS